MKGLYMVDADRGFVQYFENLLFTHSKEYKMLGHNFKANEFLTKIKERPDLLEKIDLLFINPKLNDLNGLELFKKVQSSRKDINVCVLVNENIKTFYENDIAELGIENVIIYPNTDEYYLNSVKKIFEKIENKSHVNVNENSFFEKPQVKVSDKDIFAELNSDDFLKQFDFNSLAAEVFGTKKEDEKPIFKSEPEVQNNEPKMESINQFNNSSFLDITKDDEAEEIVNNNPYSNTYENNKVNFNDYSNNVGFDNKQEPLYPSFGPNSASNNSNDIFGLNNDKSSDIFGINDSHNDIVGVDNSSNLDDFNYNFDKSPSFEDNYDPYMTNSNVDNIPNNVGFGHMMNENNQSNPLDLSVFGVNTNPNSNSNVNPNNTASFDSPSYFEDNSADNEFSNGFNNDFNNGLNNGFNGGFNNQPYQQENIMEPENILNKSFNYVENDFDLPYDGFANANQKSNLQSLDRPDIDSIDTFENYGQGNNPIYNQSNEQPFGLNSNLGQNNNFGSNNNLNPNNNFGGDSNFGQNTGFGVDNMSFENPTTPAPSAPPTLDRHAGFNKPTPTPTPTPENTGFNGFANSTDFGSSGFGGNSSPSDFGMFDNKPEAKENPYDEYLRNARASEQEQMKQAQSNLGGFATIHEQDNNQPRQFGGFDFGKPPVQNNEPATNNPQGFNNPIMSNNGGMSNNGAPQNNGFNSDGNKSYIENMYNKVGVEGLNYTPTAQNDRGVNNVIKHERTADSNYNQVPDFARQVVAFYSTKGGIGKTSLAVNATIQLAKYSKKKICLIDFDLTNANVHTHLGILDSTYDLSVVSNFESEIDSFSLSRIVTPYRVKDKNGETVEFDVIVGFKEMKMAQRFSEKEVYKILCILEEMYDIVIVDTHPVYTDLAVSTILKKATKIVFVTEQEMTALNGAKDFILASKKYNIPPEKLFMVLNRYKSQTSIFNKNRIEKGLNKTVLATIPFDMDSLREAVNTNNPVTLASPDTELARAYIDVAKIIDTKLVVPEENKSFFKLFKK